MLSTLSINGSDKDGKSEADAVSGAYPWVIANAKFKNTDYMVAEVILNAIENHHVTILSNRMARDW